MDLTSTMETTSVSEEGPLIENLIEKPESSPNWGCRFIYLICITFTVTLMCYFITCSVLYYFHLHWDHCLIRSNGSGFSYQWPREPYYNASFETKRKFRLLLNESILCLYDDRDPPDTFGAFIATKNRSYCVNGACEIDQIAYWSFSLVFTIISGGLIVALVLEWRTTNNRRQNFADEINYDEQDRPWNMN